MRTEEEIIDDAWPGRAFPNATAWEIWQAGNCLVGNGCVRDEDAGGPTGAYCPLIAVSLIHEVTPSEWVAPGQPDDDYEIGDCTEYAEAADPPAGRPTQPHLMTMSLPDPDTVDVLDPGDGQDRLF